MTLSGSAKEIAGFTAPTVTAKTTFVFTLTVSDGSATDTDTVTVVVELMDPDACATNPIQTHVQSCTPGTPDPDICNAFRSQSFCQSLGLAGNLLTRYRTRTSNDLKGTSWSAWSSWTQEAYDADPGRSHPPGGYECLPANVAWAEGRVGRACAIVSQGCVLGNGTYDSAELDCKDVTNQAPIADAGDDDTVAIGDDVGLDGSGSSDPDGDALTYSWTHTGGTPTITLTNETTTTPSFTAPSVTSDTDFTFELEVSDGALTATDTVTVTVAIASNTAPVADAGTDGTHDVNAAIGLDGSASTDADGDTLTYSWSQTGGTTNVTLADATTSTPSFTAPATPDTFEFTLTVSDGTATDTDTVEVEVTCHEGWEFKNGKCETEWTIRIRTHIQTCHPGTFTPYPDSCNALNPNNMCEKSVTRNTSRESTDGGITWTHWSDWTTPMWYEYKNGVVHKSYEVTCTGTDAWDDVADYVNARDEHPRVSERWQGAQGWFGPQHYPALTVEQRIARARQ